jgi:hypothetical protein
MDKKVLWLHLTSYHFDHLVPPHLWDMITTKFGDRNASEKAFADKLSRKLDWDKEFAMKAIWEYKKFIFLGVISDFSVTPSKIIDQVWHEHLLFTAGYRSFCEQVIRYNFEHHPELVPADSQTEAFEAQYFKTIELYQREFGCEPPTDIWFTTKFKERKNRDKGIDTTSPTDSNSGTPLIDMFPDSDNGDFDYGGGEFGGGGSSGDWDNSSSDSSDGDSGGSSDGGSSCSSSCGGGGD